MIEINIQIEVYGEEIERCIPTKQKFLKVSTKWFSDKANEDDIVELDELINRRSQEGWELATYDYMATSSQIRGAFLVTFRKEN